MITGQFLRLREWREADLPALAELRNDADLQALLLARPRGSSLAQIRRWLEEKANDPTMMLLIVADIDTDVALGYLQVSELGSLNRCCELGICLQRESRGRGRGRETINLASVFLNRVWQVRKLLVRVRADNTPAISCYFKAGFVESGRLRKHTYVDGCFHDLVLMERFLDEPS